MSKLSNIEIKSNQTYDLQTNYFNTLKLTQLSPVPVITSEKLTTHPTTNLDTNIDKNIDTNLDTNLNTISNTDIELTYKSK